MAWLSIEERTSPETKGLAVAVGDGDGDRKHRLDGWGAFKERRTHTYRPLQHIAVIDVDGEGIARVLECEMGHCGFRPRRDEDRVLAAALEARAKHAVSCEMVLALRPDDPLWSAPGLLATRSGRMAMLARLTGA